MRPRALRERAGAQAAELTSARCGPTWRHLPTPARCAPRLRAPARAGRGGAGAGRPRQATPRGGAAGFPCPHPWPAGCAPRRGPGGAPGHGGRRAQAPRGGARGQGTGPGLLVGVLGLRDAQGDRGEEPAPGRRVPRGAAAHLAVLRVVGAAGPGRGAGARGGGGSRSPPERPALPAGTCLSCRRATRTARRAPRAPSSPRSRASPPPSTKCGTWRSTSSPPRCATRPARPGKERGVPALPAPADRPLFLSPGRQRVQHHYQD